MRRLLLALFLVAPWLSGCGSSEVKTVIPDQPLTAEQQAAIKTDDQQVSDEEGGKVLRFGN